MPQGAPGGAIQQRGVEGMATTDLPGAAVNAHAFADSKFGSQAAARLRTAFERSRHPMLIADDQRRWVTGNAPASQLLGIAREEIPWHTIDEFTPPSDQGARGAMGGVPDQWRGGGLVPARPFPTGERWPSSSVGRPTCCPHVTSRSSSRPRDNREQAVAPWPTANWTPVAEDSGRLELTEREREVMTLVASGLQTGDMAERLFLSPETVKSHVQNSMGKLGAHTRAHAVAIALVTGQIAWEI